MADDVEALFTYIARALRASNTSAVVEPLEVAEVTVRWAPYAKVRGELGIATNEDYELLLMRLLAGEGGFVFADESLQDDLRREVTSPNPDLTALRTYGAARITLAREHTKRVLGLETGDLPTASADTAATRLQSLAASPVGDPTAVTPEPRVAAPPTCQFCGHGLPTGRTVHFCPHCGLNVGMKRCPGCSSEILPGWKFCVTCGRAQKSAPAN
ncbi:MAG TPA: zinc ribbon domain-containing protein [Gemmatimonadaceae bacterium]|nr:zinc ribbon domain-containing protein [Gemmatimonadaceae bacterium]